MPGPFPGLALPPEGQVSILLMLATLTDFFLQLKASFCGDVAEIKANLYFTLEA